MRPPRTFTLLSAPPGDRASFARLLSKLDQRPPLAPIRLVIGPRIDGVGVNVPARIVDVLETLLRELGSGHAIALQPLGPLITLARAGALLGISRKQLDRLIDSRGIATVVEAGRQRIPADVVLELCRERASADATTRDRTIAAYTETDALEL
jgi:hypothetical protein